MAIVYKHRKDAIPQLPASLPRCNRCSEKLLAKLPEDRFANAHGSPPRALEETLARLALALAGAIAHEGERAGRRAAAAVDPRRGHARALGGGGSERLGRGAHRSCQLREEGRLDRARADVCLPRGPRPGPLAVAPGARGAAPLRAGGARHEPYGITPRQRPGRYAQELRRAMRTAEPGRKLDVLLVGAHSFR